MQKKNFVLGSPSLFTKKRILFLFEISKIKRVFILVIIIEIILPEVNVSVSPFVRVIWFSIVYKGEPFNHRRLANFHNQGHHSQRRPGCPAIVSASSSYRHTFKSGPPVL